MFSLPRFAAHFVWGERGLNVARTLKYETMVSRNKFPSVVVVVVVVVVVLAKCRLSTPAI